jgi:hypothetical protein
MIKANFKLRVGDLDMDLVQKLKNLFSKNNIIEINIKPLDHSDLEAVSGSTA